MANYASVFISYSRKDYYFAESLTSHLLMAGIPAWLDVKNLRPGEDWDQRLEQEVKRANVLLLVASPSAMKSRHVSAEWQEARKRGTRIIVLEWYRKVQLPQELSTCERVDFRGSFARAIARLLRSLKCPSAPQKTSFSFSYALPPGVAMVAVGIAQTFLTVLWMWAITSNSVEIAPSATPAGVDVLVGIPATCGLAWLLIGPVLTRKAGTTWTLVSLLIALVPCGRTLWLWASCGIDWLRVHDEVVALQMVRAWPLTATLIALPLAGLALLAGRNADLLRWASTGKAWNWLRLPAEGLGVQPTRVADPFAGLERYRLLYDPRDANIAHRLRATLEQLGATEYAMSDRKATTVLVLSSGADPERLNAGRQDKQAPFVPVVCTAVAVTETMKWLWGRQWIDYRGLRLDRAQKRGLPVVPEAVDGTRVPTPVAQLHVALCGLGMLLLAMVPIFEGPESSTMVTPLDAASLVLMACGSGLLRKAHLLLRRRASPHGLVRFRALLLTVAVLAAVATTARLLVTQGPSLMAYASLPVAVALAVWIRRLWPRSEFWLPSGTPDRSPALAAKSDFRTLWVALGWFVLWALPMNDVLPN